MVCEEPGPCASHRLPERAPAPRCARCAAPVAPSVPDGTPCPACRRRPPPFQGARVLFDYRASRPLAAWILAFKSGRRRDLAAPLGQALAGLVSEASGEDVLVAVPLAPARRVERGFDQALALAREVSAAGGPPVVRALARRRWSAPQGAPGAVSRRAGVRDAFRPRRGAARRIARRRVWLVDDVITSGATAAECARILGRMGAREVIVVALARAGGGRT
ncbi:MAG: phosphoribosyltransferase [Planctomycetes bacterium]|nr:phosphoribosyltransferase [Planctomycetota bacterium]